MNETRTLEDFYSNGVRRDSPEVSFGVGWRSSEDSVERSIFWLEVTEELCAQRSPRLDVGLTGDYANPFDPFPTRAKLNKLDPSSITVEIIARLDRAELEAALRDWEAHVGQADGYGWFLERVKAFTTR